jgi:hypothetical protein
VRLSGACLESGELHRNPYSYVSIDQFFMDRRFANPRFAVTARDAVQQITRIVLMRIAGVNLNENDSHQYY